MTLDKHANHLMNAKVPTPANSKHSVHRGLSECDLQWGAAATESQVPGPTMQGPTRSGSRERGWGWQSGRALQSRDL